MCGVFLWKMPKFLQAKLNGTDPASSSPKYLNHSTQSSTQILEGKVHEDLGLSNDLRKVGNDRGPFLLKLLTFTSLNSTQDLAGQMIHRTENVVYYISLHIREIDTEENIHNLYTHTST